MPSAASKGCQGGAARGGAAPPLGGSAVPGFRGGWLRRSPRPGIVFGHSTIVEPYCDPPDPGRRDTRTAPENMVPVPGADIPETDHNKHRRHTSVKSVPRCALKRGDVMASEWGANLDGLLGQGLTKQVPLKPRSEGRAGTCGRRSPSELRIAGFPGEVGR